jgi:hypothetical protein
MKQIALVAMILAAWVSQSMAYDITANFSQDKPELVSGFYLKAGPTKGGPYPNITDCGKPTAKADGTYDCIGKGYTANPVYAVVANYDGAKKEIATSGEATLSLTVQPPGNLKLVVTVQTISALSKYGNPIAKTTIKRIEVPADKMVKEGSSSYRNRSGEYVTNTVIAFN